MKKVIIIFATVALVGLSFFAQGQGQKLKKEPLKGKVKVIVLGAGGEEKVLEERFEGRMPEVLKEKIKEFTKDQHVELIDVLKSPGSEEVIFDFEKLHDKDHGVKVIRFPREKEGTKEVLLEKLHKDGDLILFDFDENGTDKKIKLEFFDADTVHTKEIEIEKEAEIVKGEDGKKVIKVEFLGEGDKRSLLEEEIEEKVYDFVDKIEVDGQVKKRTITIKISHTVTIEDILEEELPKNLQNARETEFGSQMKGLNFYPNPNDGRFKLSFQLEKAATTTISIYDLQGRRVYRETLKDFSGTYTNEIDLTDRDKGLYILKVAQGDKAFTKKIVLE